MIHFHYWKSCRQPLLGSLGILSSRKWLPAVSKIHHQSIGSLKLDLPGTTNAQMASLISTLAGLAFYGTKLSRRAIGLPTSNALLGKVLEKVAIFSVDISPNCPKMKYNRCWHGWRTVSRTKIVCHWRSSFHLLSRTAGSFSLEIFHWRLNQNLKLGSKTQYLGFDDLELLDWLRRFQWIGNMMISERGDNLIILI